MWCCVAGLSAQRSPAALLQRERQLLGTRWRDWYRLVLTKPRKFKVATVTCRRWRLLTLLSHRGLTRSYEALWVARIFCMVSGRRRSQRMRITLSGTTVQAKLWRWRRNCDGLRSPISSCSRRWRVFCSCVVASRLTSSVFNFSYLPVAGGFRIMSRTSWANFESKGNNACRLEASLDHRKPHLGVVCIERWYLYCHTLLTPSLNRIFSSALTTLPVAGGIFSGILNID